MGKRSSIERLGIMGGTFDPIHIGHLVTAEEAKAEFDLDRVLFIPAARPPHKQERKRSPVSDRYRMVELAVEQNENLEASPIEMERGGLSYTIDTLRELHRIYGADTELFFVTGADAIMEILTWKDPLEVLSESRFIAATRPGYPLKRLEEALPEGRISSEQVMERIHVMEIPALAISSTDIRERAREGRPYRYLVTDPVWRYIRDEGLYIKEKEEEDTETKNRDQWE